jgi:hypothetical protein
VLDVEPMSNLCAGCKKNLPHDEEMCPKNVNCSAKAMEVIGTSTVGQNLYGSYEAFIYVYVGNGNSSTKQVLRHSWEEEVLAGIRVEVPRYKDGKKKPDDGVFPIEHPSIMWLADKGHCVR